MFSTLRKPIIVVVFCQVGLWSILTKNASDQKKTNDTWCILQIHFMFAYFFDYIVFFKTSTAHVFSLIFNSLFVMSFSYTSRSIWISLIFFQHIEIQLYSIMSLVAPRIFFFVFFLTILAMCMHANHTNLTKPSIIRFNGSLK
jgi:hypothetical protein